MSGPAAQTEAQTEAKKYEVLQESQFTSDLGEVMATGQGRRVMYRMVFSIAGAESLSYSGNNDQTNFREGRRDVGLTLMREMQDRHPELYLQMLSEAVIAAADVTRRTKRISEEAHGRDDGPDDS
jgi:hypothetical protein